MKQTQQVSDAVMQILLIRSVIAIIDAALRKNKFISVEYDNIFRIEPTFPYRIVSVPSLKLVDFFDCLLRFRVKNRLDELKNTEPEFHCIGDVLRSVARHSLFHPLGKSDKLDELVDSANTYTYLTKLILNDILKKCNPLVTVYNTKSVIIHHRPWIKLNDTTDHIVTLSPLAYDRIENYFSILETIDTTFKSEITLKSNKTKLEIK